VSFLRVGPTFSDSQSYAQKDMTRIAFLRSAHNCLGALTKVKTLGELGKELAAYMLDFLLGKLASRSRVSLPNILSDQWTAPTSKGYTLSAVSKKYLWENLITTHGEKSMFICLL
jgi:hypothetical protein